MSTRHRPFGYVLLTLLALASCEAAPTETCIGQSALCADLVATTVEISPGSVSLSSIEETIQLSATVRDQLGNAIDTAVVAWVTTSQAVAPVTQEGVVTAVANGTATVAATSGSASGSVEVTVQQAPTSMTLAPDPIELPGPGSASIVMATVLDGGGTEIVTFDMALATGDPSVATVIDEGVVTAVGEGQTTITVDVTAGGQSIRSQTTATVSAPSPGLITGLVVDAVTSEAISGASLALTGGGLDLMATTDAGGLYQFPSMPGGTYAITASVVDFVPSAANGLAVDAGIGDVVRADFALAPTGSTQRFGGVSGTVFFAGAPLPGATVSISGGAQTNGIFQSTTTDADGTYAMVGIGLDDTEGSPIAEFTVVSTFGFSAASASVTPIQDETLPNVDLNLSPNQDLTAFFADDFETAETGWTETGFWHRSTLANATNTAHPDYVNLAPSDKSGGALPQPIQG